jgi:mannose/fructose/N-acetylgalactosamine-specific phosphotransferase system component IIC
VTLALVQPSFDIWLVWFGVAGLGAALSLDETSLAQTWFSQPLPAALLAGLLVGDPAAALLPGFFMQLVVLGNLPVGEASTVDASSATVGVVAGVLIAGWNPGAAISPLAAWSSPVGWQVGLMLLTMALAGHVGGRLVRQQRRTHLAWKLASYRQIRDGDFDVVVRLHRKALAMAAARGAAVTLLWAVLVAFAWPLVAAAMPEFLRQALQLVPPLTVPLALATMSERFGHPRAVPLLAVSVALGFLVGRWLA